MRDSVEARRCQNCGTEHYTGHPTECEDCIIEEAVGCRPSHIDRLRDIEGRIRSLSVDVWTMCVDDPETATVESEAAGMTDERAELRAIVFVLDSASEWVEKTINERLRLNRKGE